jgi:hypothetical protein
MLACKNYTEQTRARTRATHILRCFALGRQAARVHVGHTRWHSGHVKCVLLIAVGRVGRPRSYMLSIFCVRTHMHTRTM